MPFPSIPYWRLSAFYFAYLGALGAFSPYFAPYLETRGLSAFEISVVMSLWYATRIYAPSLWGSLSARANSPIRWLRAGALATLIGFALFLLPLGYAGVLVVMTLFASFYNAIMPQFEAITFARLGAQRSLYGRIRVWGSVGFVLANVGYGALLQWLGYGWLIWALIPVYALLVYSSWQNSDPPQPLAAEPAPGFRDTVMPRLRERALWGLLLAAFANQIAHGPFYVFFSLYLSRNHYQAQQIGGYWAVGVLAEILMFLLVPRLLRWLTPRQVIALSFAIGALRWTATATLPHMAPVLVLAQCGHAFTFAALHSASMQSISQLFPGRSGVHGQGLIYGFSSGGGGVIGALMAGALWEFGGGRASFLGAALVSLAGLVIAWKLLPREQTASA
ncbi:MAG: MFS transporter [Lysobacterales bacterium]